MKDLLFAAACAVAFGIGAATAHPPPGAPGPFSSWFESLRVPSGVVGCCSVADCRYVEYRVANDHYEAFVDPKAFPDAMRTGWVAIPNSVVLHRANPTGQAVLCWWGGQARCFVPAEGV